MTAGLPDPAALPRDVPNAKSVSPFFAARLIGAWAAMGFRTPRVTYVQSTLE